jgi:hypothetical protein
MYPLKNHSQHMFSSAMNSGLSFQKSTRASRWQKSSRWLQRSGKSLRKRSARSTKMLQSVTKNGFPRSLLNWVE